MILYYPSGMLRRKFSDSEFLEICSLTPHVIDQTKKSIRERVYCILNNITEYSKCPECGSDVNFLRDNRYAKYCSNTCKNSSKMHNDLIKETLLKNYGVTAALKSDIIMSRKNKTVFEKYGVTNLMLNQEIKNSVAETNLERYGVKNPAQCQVIKDKISISHANNYQARRNEEGKDYKGVVYILHFPEHNAVKIGLSGDFEQRSKGLIKDFGEFNIVELIETYTCFKLEQELHEKFSDFRICLNEGTGRTEFFKEEILGDIK